MRDEGSEEPSNEEKSELSTSEGEEQSRRYPVRQRKKPTKFAEYI